MEQFVRAIEIWVPGKNGLVLELGSAYYGDLVDLKSTSEVMSFAYDEGLPGKTWSTGLPIVLTDFESGYFQRTDIVKKTDIVCGISLPIYCGEFLQAVVVLFCGGGQGVAGAMEVWHNANGSNNELKLLDGYYGVLDKFEWISRRLSILKGRGLPGIAWDQGRPIIINDLGHSTSFLRASHAADVGITTGLAIPFSSHKSDIQVLTLLSMKGTPIAKRFEIWMMDDVDNILKYDSGECYLGTDLGKKYAGQGIKKGEGPLGEAWLTGRPLVVTINPEEGNVIVVLPVSKNGELKSMVCLML